MQSPRDDDTSRSRRQIPAIARRLEEDEEAIRNGDDKLSLNHLSARLDSNGARERRTSTRMSLCRSTRRRMFAMVIIIMKTNVPTIIPCDHASSVKCAGSEGLAGRGLSMAAGARVLITMNDVGFDPAPCKDNVAVMFKSPAAMQRDSQYLWVGETVALSAKRCLQP